jgi:Flp pilus assembly protein TadG
MWRNKGQTIVEITLILPLLLLLVGAAVDWGLLFFVSHVAQNAVREGARVAVTKTSMTKASIENVVKDKIPQTPLFADFRNSAAITVSCTGTPPFITVQTTGSFNYMFMRLIGFTYTTITRSAIMRPEFETCPSIT